MIGDVKVSILERWRLFTDENRSFVACAKKKADPTPFVKFTTSLEALANLGKSKLELDYWDEAICLSCGFSLLTEYFFFSGSLNIVEG